MLSLPGDEFVRLLEVLREDGHRVIGPTVRDGAIVYDEIEGAHDLPRGIGDEQAPARYRLRQREDDALFGYVVGPHSWKRFVFPPSERLVTIRRRDEAPQATAVLPAPEPVAFVGVRACEIAALDVLDRTFVGGPHVDPRYAARRSGAFVLAVNCLEPGELCFCASMGTGPRAEAGYDLCLTELGDRFLLEVGSPRGQAVVDRLAVTPATPVDEQTLDRGIAGACASMGRAMDPRGLPELLFGNLDHAQWDDVAERCLSCGNCTQVCPTCFCQSKEHPTVVGDDTAAQVRSWDSCFTDDHAAVHGGTFRPTIKDRYRQWLTHKVGSWVSQYGVSGCVGCGRCIAWCPVGIDITEEVAAIRADPAPPVPMPPAPVPHVVAGDAYVPRPARVLAVVRETDDVVTLEIEAPPGFEAAPGQFNMLSLPGVGEPPISVAGRRGAAIQHTIRAVGPATEALCALRRGDELGLRGPFGSGWPLALARERPVIAIAGGIGLAPLRAAIEDMLADPEHFRSVRLLYGARTPDDLLYDQELLAWCRQHPQFKASVTVDRGSPSWAGNVGVVTTLMRRKELPADGVYFLCGPEIMMRFVTDELLAIGVSARDIWLAMERNMHCGIGQCGRCQYGPWFVCKDGPVFSYESIAMLFGREGF